MTRRLWIDPAFGAAGDMLLGALVGLDPSPNEAADAVRLGLAGLDIDGWSLDLAQVTRCSLSAWRTEVEASEATHHRSWTTIDSLLAASALPDAVAAGARATFRRLAEVEAAIHNVAIDDVHFHEVGAIDAIVDIVGCWLALDRLQVEHVTVGTVGLGTGTVEASHGTLPLPAPATAALLIGAPVRPVETQSETVTPTGAALLATMGDHWGPMPAGRLDAVARGAGGRNPDGYPNVVTAMVLLSAVAAETSPSAGGAIGRTLQTAVQLTTNLDDVTPEIIGRVMAQAMALGADDAWSSPITMKKSRPAVALSILCRPDLAAAIEDLVFSETATLGIRSRQIDKLVLDRRTVTVEVEGRPVRIKVGPHFAKPEFDDVAEVATATGQAFRQVSEVALQTFRDLD